MAQAVFPFGLFLLLLFAGVVVCALGIRLLQQPRGARKPHRAGADRPLGIVAIALGLLLVGGTTSWGVFWIVQRQDLDSRFTFTYTVQFEFNGSGVVLVSLPIPTEERLLAGLEIEGISATFAYNRSGAEPALDVTFSEPTNVSAHFLGRTPPDQFDPANLTRNDGQVSTLALAVLSGDVTSVHVEFEASWIRTCFVRTWEQDVWLSRGVSDHPGRWWTIVC